MVGFKVIAKLLPFCLAIAKGIEKGVHEYKALTLKSGAFAGKGDTAKLEKFMALMMLVSGLVSAVPLITICIFFYQAFASQIFILVVMGIEISAISKAFAGYMGKRAKQMTSGVSGVMILTGLIMWVYEEAAGMLAAEDIIDLNNISISGLNVSSILFNAVFNFYFSKLCTCELIAQLAAEMFKHVDGVRAGYMVPDPLHPNGEAWQASDLESLDVWSEQNHAVNGRKSASKVVPVTVMNDEQTVALKSWGKDEDAVEKKQERKLVIEAEEVELSQKLLALENAIKVLQQRCADHDLPTDVDGILSYSNIM
jgi:hypothetical protein